MKGIKNFRFLLLKKMHCDVKKEKGFTLIELLVVIGILGILATALIATIDPFQQLKKAQDANVKNTAVEFVNAGTRYYTTHNAMMWSVDTACGGAGLTAPVTANLNSAQMITCLTDLLNDGEIKAGFTTATGLLTSIYVSGTTNSLTACFLPQSKSGQNDPNAKYNKDGTLTGAAANCPATNPGGTTCYWCSE
ncbi:MAG TPA: type II secretion system protein [Patescibacteria group bacterium]|nr:type II secretion system protein [Patescibacteria group bacterium]